MKKTIFLLLVLILIFVASCGYTEPLPPLSSRVGVYKNTPLEYTITIPDNAKTIEIKIPKLKEDGTVEKDPNTSVTMFQSLFVSTIGPNDTRLDYYTGTVRVVLDAQNFNTLYLYTNTYIDDEKYDICTK